MRLRSVREADEDEGLLSIVPPDVCEYVVGAVVDELNRSGRKLVGDEVDPTRRWIFPVGCFLMVGLIAPVFLSKATTQASPAPPI